MDDIKREIAIMKKVNHPNVLQLYEVMDDPKVMTPVSVLFTQRKRYNTSDKVRDSHHTHLNIIRGIGA